MDACGRDRDTDLRLFFSSAGGPSGSRNRRSRGRGRRSGHWRARGRRRGRSWWRGDWQLDDKSSPLLPPRLLSPPLLPSLLSYGTRREGSIALAGRFAAVESGGEETRETRGSGGLCCKPSNPGRRDRSRVRRLAMLFRRSGAFWQHPTGPDKMAGVAVRVALEIILMLGLRLPERAGRRDFCHHF